MTGKALVAGLVVILGAACGAMGQPVPSSLQQQYEQKLKAIDVNKADDHYGLGEWAFQNNLNDIALKELQAALALDPKHVKAGILLPQVQAKVGKPVTQPGTTTRETTPVGTAIPQDWVVPQDDIYRIRMEELRPEDRVPIKFRADVINRFVKKWQGREEFRATGFEDTFRGWAQTSPARAVEFMREKNPDDLEIKDDILVDGNPKFMTDFTSKVLPVVLSSCATASCHGSGDPNRTGGLRILAARSERLDYTNYLILDGHVSRNRRLIDRGDPDSSLLLQYLLPEDLAQFRHPAPPLTPTAASRTDAKYLAILAWIRSLHQPPHPDYRLKYKLPLGMKYDWKSDLQLPPPGRTTAPTSKPAGR